MILLSDIELKFLSVAVDISYEKEVYSSVILVYFN